jgi:hypothetical protein
VAESGALEFGSSAWITLAEEYLAERIPALGDALRGVSFSMSEAFTSAPTHLADATGRAGWWFELDGATVRSGHGVRDDVDMRVDVDYQDTLVLARLVFDLDDPEIRAMLAERGVGRRESLGDAAADAFEALPPELRSCLIDLHNFLAPRTA